MAAARRRGDRGPRCGHCASSGGGLPLPGSPVIPAYRRLRYLRYADDHLFRVHRPEGRSRAESNSASPASLHDDLKLELSEGKDADHPRPAPRPRRFPSATTSPVQQQARAVPASNGVARACASPGR